MDSGWKKGKTIHSEARKMVNRVNHRCEQEALWQSLDLLICSADERTANCCWESVAEVKRIRLDSRQIMQSCRGLFFNEVHMPPTPPPRPHNAHPHY
jgi:hypothetical protein